MNPHPSCSNKEKVFTICSFSPVKEVARLGSKTQHTLRLGLSENHNDLVFNITRDLVRRWAPTYPHFTAEDTRSPGGHRAHWVAQVC